MSQFTSGHRRAENESCSSPSARGGLVNYCHRVGRVVGRTHVLGQAGSQHPWYTPMTCTPARRLRAPDFGNSLRAALHARARFYQILLSVLDWTPAPYSKTFGTYRLRTGSASGGFILHPSGLTAVLLTDSQRVLAPVLLSLRLHSLSLLRRPKASVFPRTDLARRRWSEDSL